MTTVAQSEAGRQLTEEAGDEEPPDEPPEPFPFRELSQNDGRSQAKELDPLIRSDSFRSTGSTPGSPSQSLRIRRAASELEVDIPTPKKSSAPIAIPGVPNVTHSMISKTPEQRRNESSFNFLSSISLQAPSSWVSKKSSIDDSVSSLKSQSSQRKTGAATAESSSVQTPSLLADSKTSTPLISPSLKGVELSPKQYSSSMEFLSNITLEPPQLTQPPGAAAGRTLSSSQSRASSSGEESRVLNMRCAS